MQERINGLDQFHIELLLEKLAKFHATSAVHYQRNGPFSNHFSWGLFKKEIEESFGPYYQRLLTCFIKFTETWPFASDFVETIRKWDNRLFQRNNELMKPNPNGFNVLCHGDIWMNNAMFANTETKKDAMLVS